MAPRDISDLFGGYTGRAAKAIKGRKSKIDAAVDGAVRGTKKKKATKKKAAKKRRNY